MKNRHLRIAMAQINPTVGDLVGNTNKIKASISAAKRAGADLVALPELAVTGYPPEDLVLKPQFVKDNLRALDDIAESARGITAIVGFVDSIDNALFDAAAIIAGGGIRHRYHKMLLPNYGVFDEHRYFTPGQRYAIVAMNGIRIGINICEDIWHADGPARTQALAGAEVIVALNASPYHAGKGAERRQMLAERARMNNVFIAYANMVGGQDELVFDGQSMALDRKGRLISIGRQFDEEIVCFDLSLSDRPRVASMTVPHELIDIIELPSRSHRTRTEITMHSAKPYKGAEEIYRALVLGTRDYLHKSGFRSAVIGLSGGIDSSLVAAVAVEALGREQVTGVFMPSRYSSEESRKDAADLAANLGITMQTIPIHQPFDAYSCALHEAFAGARPDVTEENLQARIRGNILMALSNKFGWLVLTTGNKSEMSTGYATLYGDMAGGFAVIKDVPKTMVYDICRCINRLSARMIIPRNVLKKAPTAELRPNQKDSDSLPEYDILDPILKAYVEDDKEFDEMLAMGFDRKTVECVIRLVDSSEYKRRQAPPGVKITRRGLGRDRRFPITNRYRSY